MGMQHSAVFIGLQLSLIAGTVKHGLVVRGTAPVTR